MDDIEQFGAGLNLLRLHRFRGASVEVRMEAFEPIADTCFIAPDKLILRLPDLDVLEVSCHALDYRLAGHTHIAHSVLPFNDVDVIGVFLPR